MSDNDGGWLTPEVAEAQLELVERELAALRGPNRLYPYEPYGPFLNALWHIKDRFGLPQGTRLLDAGCGVGHYGTLCRYLRPEIEYIGSDLSPYMIRLAHVREPGLTFLIRAVLDNQFEAYDIVLLSQCLEVTPSPVEALTSILGRATGTIILHRLRLADDAGQFTEPTYAGHVGYNWHWRLEDIGQLVRDAGRSSAPIPWATRQDITTLVIWPPQS